MRLKSLLATNQRIKRTCVANIFMLCLLTNHVWSFANIKYNRFARQANDEVTVNYEDFSMANPYHQPHFTGNRSVVVQLFEWKFVDIAAECRDFLGPQGYAGVQLSPVLEHTIVNTDDFNHPWWERSEVVSYRLASRSGDETEFWSMSRICNEHGVRIYADVVLNHMAAPLHYMGITEEETEDHIVNTLLETNVNLKQLNYSYVPYTHNDFHKPTCLVLTNTQDAHVIRNCQLNGHPDLDHSRGNVQKQVVKMLNKFVDMGVAGFRVDTAKYMWPIDMKNIFKQVKNLSTEFNFKKNSRPFVYFDVFDLGFDAVSKTEYSTYGVVSEYLYAAELSTILRGKVPLSSLINWGPAMGFLSHEDSLVFIDSPDTQRGLPWELGKNRMLTYKQRIKYIMANVFMLVHPYGTIKRIMSSYYFPSTDINRGPPADEEEIRSPKYDERKQCTQESGWVCEHRWPQMVNLIKVANYFRAAGNKEESVIYFQTNGPNQVAFCRGHKAFVAINNAAENDFIKEVYACLEPGFYCDMVTGGKKDGLEECHGKMLEINGQGYTKLVLNVADDKRNKNQEGIETEEKEGEGVEAEEEVVEEGAEVTDEIQSYGIVVIYVESKIKPADKNEEENKTLETDGNGSPEENSKELDKNEDKLTTEDEQDVEGKENDIEQEQEQENDETDNEELEPAEAEKADDEETGEEETQDKMEVPEEEEAREEETQDKVDEPAQEDEVDLTKSENEEKIGESLETGEGEENQAINDAKEEEEVKESSEHDLSKENETDTQNEEDTDVEENNEENENKEDEEEAETEDVVKEKEHEQETEDDLEQNLDDETAASKDTGNNQSRNWDEKTDEETEEQIEKPSAEVVDTAADVSDTVTAKIQDIQKAGILSNRQDAGNNG